MQHHPEPESHASLRTKALESLLVEKGILSTDAIDALVQAYEKDIGPRNGARVVARAWTDAEYKARLLQDGTTAIDELGFASVQGEELIAVENTQRCTISLFARCARVTRPACLDSLQNGTRTSRTAVAQLSNPAQC